MRIRLEHLLTGLAALLSLYDARRRRLWAEMRAYLRALPPAFERPLPEMLAAQTPPAADLAQPQADIRRLADAVALFERGSPLGLCLRRSLLRYHFLRRAGLPLVIHFGVRFQGSPSERSLGGHAWVTLDGQPYYEEAANSQGFVVMLRYPEET